MRLLVVSHYFWPEDMRVNDLVRGMRERGHDVTVLANIPNYPEGRVYEAYRQDPRAFGDYHGAEVIRVPVIPRGRSKFGLMLNYLTFVISACTMGVWKLRGRAFDSIFVFQNSPLTAAVPAVMLRAIKRAPLSMWILDVWPETLKAIGVIRSERLLRLAGLLSDFVYRNCDLILVQSRAFDANVRKHSGGRLGAHYFPNWTEPLFENGAASVPAPEAEAESGVFNIMFAGNIGEAQAFPAIVEAADACRDLSDVRWLIVGEGSMSAWLRSEIDRRGLADRVRMLGRHPVDRMPAFFAAADALLVTLRPEPIWALTIPGKLQNCLASGRPVLAMLDGEGRRVVEESGGGLAAGAGDGAGLAGLVRRLHAMPAADRERMGQAGRDYARQHFDRDVLFDEFQSLLGGLKRPGPA